MKMLKNAMLQSSMYQRWVHSLMVHVPIYAVSVIYQNSYLSYSFSSVFTVNVLVVKKSLPECIYIGVCSI